MLRIKKKSLFMLGYALLHFIIILSENILESCLNYLDIS